MREVLYEQWANLVVRGIVWRPLERGNPLELFFRDKGPLALVRVPPPPFRPRTLDESGYGGMCY